MAAVYRLQDECFAHHPHTCSAGDEAHHRTQSFWTRETKSTLPLVKTHAVVSEVPYLCWLLEPWVIQPQVYERLLTDPPTTLRGVWTHSHDFIQLWRRLHPHIPITWVPNAMTFIPVDSRTLGLPLETRLSRRPCVIFSDKVHVPAHRWRQKILQRFRTRLEVYGTCTGGKPIVHKANVLSQYRFSVVMENNQTRGYFSEKLLDCFLTGCIPLYWGPPDIGLLFDTRALFTWNTEEELEHLLQNLSHRVVSETARRTNFLRALRYCSVECWWQRRQDTARL